VVYPRPIAQFSATSFRQVEPTLVFDECHDFAG
jgi:hypothetical protein